MSTWQELTTEQLTALPTHRLYNVYKLWQEKCGYLSYGYNTVGNVDEKQYDEGEAKRKFIKSILDGRGHIERDEDTQGVERIHTFCWREPPVQEPKCLIENPEDCIGKQVFKLSKKPFKSKNHYNTVKTITENPHTGRKAFTFEEDGSIVDVHVCNIRKVKKP